MGWETVQFKQVIFLGQACKPWYEGPRWGKDATRGAPGLSLEQVPKNITLSPSPFFQVSEAVGAGVEWIWRPDLHLFFANTWRSSLWACKGPCRQGQWPGEELVKFPCNVVWGCYRKKWDPRYPTLISENNGDRRGHRHLFLYWRLFPQVTCMADIK